MQQLNSRPGVSNECKYSSVILLCIQYVMLHNSTPKGEITSAGAIVVSRMKKRGDDCFWTCAKI